MVAISPNNTCLGFNNCSCWAQGNHQLCIITPTLTGQRCDWQAVAPTKLNV